MALVYFSFFHALINSTRLTWELSHTTFLPKMFYRVTAWPFRSMLWSIVDALILLESFCISTVIADGRNATQLLAATTLRAVLGTKTFAEILSDKESIAESMKIILDEATDDWGLTVERVEITDVGVPPVLQRAMAAEAEAAREARAKVIAAQGELSASRSLKEASRIIAEFPQALQLRYLQALSAISAKNNYRVLIPMDLLKR